MDTIVDKLDKQIGIAGDKHCMCVSYGILNDDYPLKLVSPSIRRIINAGLIDSDCEYAPTRIEDPVCPPELVLQPEYKFIVGQPVGATEIVYGHYWFETGNTNAPTASDLAFDIATYPPGSANAHYWSDQWNPLGVDAQIIAPKICYHVIRLSNSLGLVKLIDEAGVRVNADWQVLSDSLFTYYLLARVIAPSDLTYTVKE